MTSTYERELAPAEVDTDRELPPVPDWLLDAPPWDLEPCECPCCADGPDDVVVPAPRQPVAVGWAVPGVWPDPEPDSSPLVVGPLVAALEAAVSALEAGPSPALLPPGQAMAEAQALQELQHRLRVLNLARVADVDTRGLTDLVDVRSTSTWLARANPDAPGGDLRLAKKLRALPHLHEAVQQRSVSLRAAGQVQGSLSRLRRHLDRPDGLIDGQDAEPLVANVLAQVLELVAKHHLGMADDDPLLVALDRRLGNVVLSALDGTTQAERLEQGFTALAEHVPPGKPLGLALELLVDAVLPAKLEVENASAEDARGLRLEPMAEGSWRLEGVLTPECGERLHAALSAEATRDTDNPDDTRAWAAVREQAEAEGRDLLEVLADRPPGPATGRLSGRAEENAPGIELREEPPRTRTDDSLRRPRTRSQRLHDAFNNLLGRYLGSGLGGEHGKVPVQAAVTLSTSLLDGTPGALPATGITGRPLARSLVRRWWCDTHVTVLLMSKGWRPLGVVHSGRTLTGTERKASLVQSDRRCAGTGCCSGVPDPLTPLVPHHLVMYSAAGTTSLEETAWVCPQLHHDLHTGKRTLQLRDGRWINENGVVDNPHDQPSIWD